VNLEWDHAWRIRASIALLTLIVIIPMVALSDGEFVAGGSGTALVAGALYAVPLALYVILARTTIGSIVIGLALASLLIANIHVVYESDSSTAAVGLVLTPLWYAAVPIPIVCVLDGVVRTGWQRRRSRLATRTPA
jgi:hypothetical protein